MGAIRVLGGFVVAVGMTGAWLLLICIVMLLSLYIARLVPLTGRRRSERKKSEV